MTQLTIPAGAAAPAPAAAPQAVPVRHRPMRHQRIVNLRTPLPTGRFTLRHDVPEWLGHDVPDFQTEATPKVVLEQQLADETAAGKGA